MSSDSASQPLEGQAAAPPSAAPDDSWWRRLAPIARGDVLLASVAINLLSLALPMLTLQVYDRIIPNAARATFSYLLFGLVVVLVLDIILKMSRATIAGFLGARYEHKTATNALKRLMASELEAVEREPAGAHLDRISGIDSIRDFYSGHGALALVDLPFAVLFLCLVAFIGGWLVVVPFSVLAIAILLAAWLGRGLRQSIGDRKTWDDRRYNFIIETLSGMHTVKGLAMEPLMQRRYERLLRNSSDAGHRVALLAGVSQAVGGFFGQFALASVAAFGALQVISGDLTIGGLAACTLLSGRTIQPVLRALGSWTRFQAITVAEGKLAEIAALPRETTGGRRQDPVQSLELVDASFRYTPDMPDVVSNLSIRVSVGDLVGIEGDNGSGKSTFLQLLNGRLHPSKGAFLINGLPADAFDAAFVRRQVAYLSQRSVLMQGSVIDNMTFFRPDLYLEPALEFGARLGLDEIFARIPDGYDTQIGEASSSALPRGVAQRIAIVRAMVRGPRFLLFDEANSSLDGEGERLLKSTIDAIRDDVGIILVTHRPSMLRMAERLYRLNKGVLSQAKATPDGLVNTPSETGGQS